MYGQWSGLSKQIPLYPQPNYPNWYVCYDVVPCVVFQLAVVRQVLRKELGLKIVEVEQSEKANVEGGDVLWTGILIKLKG